MFPAVLAKVNVLRVGVVRISYVPSNAASAGLRAIVTN